MSKRNFPDFIPAYYEYAKDNYCPDKFHLWTGISLVAGALERKTYLIKGKYRFYPNLYIMLVSGPGIGKSSAMQIGVNGILSQIDNINFISQHITEAKLVEDLARKKSFYIGNQEHIHNSSYWYISEGSNVLAERTSSGDLIPMITDLYDCPGTFSKGTKLDGTSVIENLCLNMLSGITFDFSKRLILGSNAGGGFSSRNIYVIHDTVQLRESNWTASEIDHDKRNKLIEDLSQINKMAGQFRLSQEYKDAFSNWWAEHDAKTQGYKSEILRDFMARTHTNIFKLSQIFSASESNELVLTLDHWNKAKELMDSVNSKLPAFINSGERAMFGTLGLKHTIVDVVRKNPHCTALEIRNQMPFAADLRYFADTMDALGAIGVLGHAMVDGKTVVTLIKDPQDQL